MSRQEAAELKSYLENNGEASPSANYGPRLAAIFLLKKIAAAKLTYSPSRLIEVINHFANIVIFRKDHKLVTSSTGKVLYNILQAKKLEVAKLYYCNPLNGCIYAIGEHLYPTGGPLYIPTDADLLKNNVVAFFKAGQHVYNNINIAADQWVDKLTLAFEQYVIDGIPEALTQLKEEPAETILDTGAGLMCLPDKIVDFLFVLAKNSPEYIKYIMALPPDERYQELYHQQIHIIITFAIAYLTGGVSLSIPSLSSEYAITGAGELCLASELAAAGSIPLDIAGVGASIGLLALADDAASGSGDGGKSKETQEDDPEDPSLLETKKFDQDEINKAMGSNATDPAEEPAVFEVNIDSPAEPPVINTATDPAANLPVINAAVDLTAEELAIKLRVFNKGKFKHVYAAIEKELFLVKEYDGSLTVAFKPANAQRASQLEQAFQKIKDRKLFTLIHKDGADYPLTVGKHSLQTWSINFKNDAISIPKKIKFAKKITQYIYNTANSIHP
ncbi:MAG: hypothetical protein JW841_13645 [Deltaproteobacteria bacterium]|nr:hypothetical protein [Deltaproteobacteria bacterium]